MADREPRKRKKRRDGQKKEDLNTEEITFSSKKFQEEVQKDSEPEPEDEIVPHEPSVVARVVFFLIFSLLMMATGVVFIALHGTNRSIDSINDMEASHSEELTPHELPLPYIQTEEWKPEESSKDVTEEPELWTEDIVENEEHIQPNSLQEEETSLPSEEILDHIEYYTQMPFEEITEQPESEETEMFEKHEELSEKEFAENYVDDIQQSYYDVEVFPITESSVDYESIISDEHTQDLISDAEETQEPLVQVTSELPIPIVESSLSSEETESKPQHVQIEESDSTKEHLRTSTEPEYSQKESSENQNVQHNVDSSNVKQGEASFSREKEYENADITNDDDFRIKEELDEIDRIIDKEPGEDDIYFWF